jgi:hypothetical protein
VRSTSTAKLSSSSFPAATPGARRCSQDRDEHVDLLLTLRGETVVYLNRDGAFAVVGDPGGALITVGLRQQTPLLGSVPISQSADGSSTVVALIRYRASLVALAVRYSASYLLAQPEPFRAALLQHWVHVYRADALEAILAARLLAAEMERVADGERAQ